MASAARALFCLVATTLCALAIGCSGGLTGGSIPPGRSKASGIVVRGDDSTVRLPGARIQIAPDTRARQLPNDDTETPTDPPTPPDFNGGGPVIQPDGRPSGSVTVNADRFGEFNVEGLPTGAATLTITPPADSGLDRIVYDLDFSGGATYWIISAPPPRSVSYAGMTGLSVSPARLDLTVGDNLQLVTSPLGGDPPRVAPSFLVRGGMGIVSERGVFSAVRAGRGSVRVVLGPFEQTISVTVEAAPVVR